MVKDCIIKVSEGLLEGEKVENEYGGSYYSFKGIPFAEPPIGDLRFKAPQSPRPWDGVRSAKNFGPINYQFDFFKMTPPEGSEDCLYINVYTPDLKPKTPYSVMVWIHGGGFFWGSGNDDLYGPEFLVRQDVILVTFNYRLGVLGFLCLESEEVPGNAGMKDQVAALRWVKKNIHNFGGDPSNVTIFGESAGAGSVAYHLISPMSKGLFKRSIIQSGAASAYWAQAFEPKERAIALAKKLGCDSTDEKELYKFLKAVPMEMLILQNLPITYRETGERVVYGFPPVNEKDFGQERFFYGDVFEAFRNGPHGAVDVMIGYVQDEAVLFFRKKEDLTLHIEEINKFTEAIVPRTLSRLLPLKEQFDIGRKIRKFYFDNKIVTMNDWRKVYECLKFEMFVYPIIFTLKSMAKRNKNKTYFYKFTCHSKRNFFKNIFVVKDSKLPVNNENVVCHCDDLSYLFPIKYYGQKVNVNSKKFKLIDRMTKLWTNFAKHGNPTPDESFGTKWEPYCLQHQHYLDIGEDLVLSSKPDDDQVEFWEGIFNNYRVKH